MEKTLKKHFNSIMAIIGISLLVCSGLNNYLGGRLSFLALYVLILVSHFTLDSKRSTLFVVVISLFLGSVILGIVGYVIQTHKEVLAFTLYGFTFVGYLLIFMSVLRHSTYRFGLNKSLWWAIPIIGLTIYVSAELLQFLESYNLSNSHLVYFFFFTIFKMIILSLGILVYLGNTKKYRKMMYLNWSMAFLFCGDIVDTITSLFFAFESLPVVQVLTTCFFCCALLFFYLYCKEPKELSIFEKESKI